MANAAIQFIQGATVGVPGQALVGVLTTSVVATNGDNSGPVVRWRWVMLDAPAGSAVPVGVISDGALATVSFAPDLTGGYHLELTTFFLDGSSTKDRRVFMVPELSGRYNPPFEAEADGLNFGGGLRGWATVMDAWLKRVDGQPATGNSGTGNLVDVSTYGGSPLVALYSLHFTGAAPNIQGLSGGYDGRVLYAYNDNKATVENESGSEATAKNRVHCPGGSNATIPAGSVAIFVFDGTISRWRLLMPGSSPQSDLVFGAEAVSTALTYTRMGARALDMRQYSVTTVKFAVTLENTIETTGFFAQAHLFDLTNNVEVAGTLLDNQGASFRAVATEFVSGALTIGGASGNLRNDANTVYSVLFRVQGSISDPNQQRAIISNARLIFIP